MGMKSDMNSSYSRDKYRAKAWDDSPMYVDKKQSVIDVRKVYPNLTHHEFAAMYCTKYRNSGLKVNQIVGFLEKYEQSKAEVE